MVFADWIMSLLIWWLICLIFLRIQKRLTKRSFAKDVLLALIQSAVLLVALYVFFHFYK